MSERKKTLDDLASELDKVSAEIILGLTENGCQAKQRSLQRALVLLCGKEFADRAHKEFKWCQP